MKNTIHSLILLALFCSGALAQSTNRITAKITVTTATSNNFALTLNGDTRVFTNVPLVSGSQIITNGSVAGSASNLNRHLASAPFQFVRLTGYTNGSNVLYLRGDLGLAMSATILSNWGTVSYSTQVFSSGLIDVRVPIETETASQATNIASLLARAIGTLATNSFPTNSTALAHYVDDSGRIQTLINDVVTNANITGGTASNVVLTNITRANIGVIMGTNVYFLAGTGSNLILTNISWLNGILGGLTNGQLVANFITNASSIQTSNLVARAGYLSNIIGHTFTITNLSAPGSGANSLVIGSGAAASGSSSVAVGVNAQATNAAGLAFGNGAISWGQGAIAVGQDAIAGADLAMAIGREALAYSNYSVAIGPAATALHAYSTAIGHDALTTTNNQVRLGTVSDTVSIPGFLEVAGQGITNSITSGTHKTLGSTAFARSDISTLANGNNIAVDFGVAKFISLSGAATTPTLCGMVRGMVSGAEMTYTVVNHMAGPLVITQNTVDPAPTNRFSLYNSADVSVPAGGWVELWYDSTSSRWSVSGTFPGTNITANATNFIIYTNQVSAGAGVFNFIAGANTTIAVTNTSGTNHIGISSSAGSSVATNTYISTTGGAGTNTTLKTPLLIGGTNSGDFGVSGNVRQGSNLVLRTSDDATGYRDLTLLNYPGFSSGVFSLANNSTIWPDESMVAIGNSLVITGSPDVAVFGNSLAATNGALGNFGYGNTVGASGSGAVGTGLLTTNANEWDFGPNNASKLSLYTTGSIFALNLFGPQIKAASGIVGGYVTGTTNPPGRFDSSNGFPMLFINTNTSGPRIGIGTSNPAVELHVMGTVQVSGTAYANALQATGSVTAASGNFSGTATGATVIATTLYVTGSATNATLTTTTHNNTGTLTSSVVTASSGNFSGTVTGATVTAASGNFSGTSTQSVMQAAISITKSNNTGSLIVTNSFVQRAVALGAAGTNLTGLDFSQANNFSYTATGNVFFVQFTNATAFQQIVVDFRQDSVGTRLVAWNTNYFKFPSGQILTCNSNANSVNVFSFIIDQYGTNALVQQQLDFR